MKILIQNYSTPLSTESLYLHKAMLESGCESIMWADQNISTFDMFDSVQPEIFLTHFSFITTDVLKYLTNSNINIVLNVTGATQEIIQHIETEFSNRKIKTPLFFTNTHELMSPIRGGNTKLINVLPALDVFIPKQEIPEFKVDTCFITTGSIETLSEHTKDKDSYHTICLGSQEKGFDFNLELPMLISFLDKYNRCVVVDDLNIVFSQLFFDVTFRGSRTNLIVPETQQDTLDKVLATLFHTQESDDITNAIQNQIKIKHNAFNRTARLLRGLKCEQEAMQVDKKYQQLMGENS